MRSCDLPPLLEQSLTMVYRLLFLLFAEARGLVPLWNAIYRASYSIEALCEGSSGLVSLGESGRGYRRSLDSPMTDVARASSSARRLTADSFRPHTLHFSRTPESMTGRPPQRFAHCRPDRHVRPAANAFPSWTLGWSNLARCTNTSSTTTRNSVTRDRPGASPCAAVVAVARRPGRSTHRARSLTSSSDAHCTHSLSTLHRRRFSDCASSTRQWGAARFSLQPAATWQLRTNLRSSSGGDLSAGDLNALDRAGFRRTIAQRCLFGVDRNPMAVQLGRFSLWLTTLASDRPLTFLDHHLRVGTVWWARRSTIWRGSPWCRGTTKHHRGTAAVRS